MTDITNQGSAGTGTDVTLGDNAIVSLTKVVDVAQAVADGFTAGDSIHLFNRPAGGLFWALDARITEALVLGTSQSTDIGLTESDPDDYVDAQTDTAVGAFTTYAAASLALARIASEDSVYMSFAGSAITSGKVAVTMFISAPVQTNIEAAKPRVYPN